VTDPTTPEVTMFNLNARLLTVSLAAWEAIIVASIFARTTMSTTTFSATEGAAWLLLAAGPIVVAALTLRGSQSASIAQVIYDAEHAPATSTVRTGGKA
jgi:hypothetical protein